MPFASVAMFSLTGLPPRLTVLSPATGPPHDPAWLS